MFTQEHFGRKTLPAQSLAASGGTPRREDVSASCPHGFFVCAQRLPLVMPNRPPGTELRPPIHRVLTARDVSAGCQKTELKN